MTIDEPCSTCPARHTCSYIQVGRCELLMLWAAQHETMALSNVTTNMVMMTKNTNIQVSMNTHRRLSKIGEKGETFDHIIERLLDVYEGGANDS